MADHERKLIRNAAKAALVGATAAGSRVFVSRMGPLANAELPAICLYTNNDETKDGADSTPRDLWREFTLSVEAWVSAAGVDPAALEDSFDALALQIETALDLDVTLGDTCSWEWPANTVTGISNQGNRPMGCIKVDYTVQYRTDQRTAARDGALPDLTLVDIKTAVTPDMPDADQAEDTITFTP